MPSNVTIKNNIPLLEQLLKSAESEGLQAAGDVMRDAILATIDSNIPPPNAPATIAKKGSSKTLFDTGEMYGSVESELRDSGKAVAVGVMGSEEAGIKAIVNEFGVPEKNIPSRPFMRMTIDNKKNIDNANNAFSEVIKDVIDKAAIK